jgi:rhodanese-related sulfurtransferase
MQSLDARGLPAGYPFNRDWEVTPREFRARREAGEAVVLIDCRTAAERATASIDGSIHVPMHELSAHLDALRAHETDPVIVHCHHGARSLQVTAALRQAGFEDVRSMAGGIHLWSLDIDPSVPVY